MKALVLSGGLGTRLRPLSHSMPKQLVPVANRPVLFHCLEKISEAGITETGIILGDRGGEIMASVGDGSEFNMKVTYIPQDAPRGLAHCVAIARDFLRDDDFVMYLGDNVLTTGITDMADDFRRRRPDVQLAVAKVSEPSEYGIAELDPDGRVISLVEKPSQPRSDLALIGVYFFRLAIHEAVRKIRPSWRGELEITDAVQWLLGQGRTVRADVYPGYWKDTGRIDDLLKCNRLLLEEAQTSLRGEIDQESEIRGPVMVEPGARVSRSRIVGPAIIGADSVIADSYVGPFTAVGSGCVLAEASIEYSIVLDGASIREIRSLQGSLIGRATEIEASSLDYRRHRMILGDHAKVDLRP